MLNSVIAIIAAYIAYQQYAINKKNSEQQLHWMKMNLDLYKLRFQDLDETKKILLKISQDAKIDLIKIRDYNFSINDSNFYLKMI